jgi:predicted small lipoprotein YifL
MTLGLAPGYALVNIDRIVVLLAFGLLVTACGQKGPLRLPDVPAGVPAPPADLPPPPSSLPNAGAQK